jgi:hypothetical protein
MKKMTTPSNHYVSNKSFHNALVAYREKCKVAEAEGNEKPRIPEYIGLCIYQIATKLATKGNFRNYSYIDEMISDGIENCINYGVRNYNPEKTHNAFAYFTRILYTAYVLRIQKEKKELYIKYKAFENEHFNSVHQPVDLDNPGMFEMNINDNMIAFVRDYESKLKTKKASAKKEETTIEDFINEDQ